jgi:hypothetical protein
VTEWKDLLDPKYKGNAAILDVPAIGIMDAALCFESAGLIKYGNKGNMTKEEIDFTINKLIELKKLGHFRATWTTFDQSVQLMAAGEVIIQSMWSPAIAAAVPARITPPSRAAFCVRVLLLHMPSQTEGTGNAGCWPHPWPSCNKKSRRQSPQVQPRQPAFPARWL